MNQPEKHEKCEGLFRGSPGLIGWWSTCFPLKINREPENIPLKKEKHLYKTPILEVPC